MDETWMDELSEVGRVRYPTVSAPVEYSGQEGSSENQPPPPPPSPPPQVLPPTREERAAECFWYNPIAARKIIYLLLSNVFLAGVNFGLTRCSHGEHNSVSECIVFEVNKTPVQFVEENIQ